MTRVWMSTHAGRYVLTSREPLYQLLLLIPLLLAYEVAAVLINFDMPFQLRNGADILLKYTLYLFGIRSVFGFVMVALLFASLMILVAYRRQKAPVKPYYFVAMMGECVIYAFLISVASARLTGLVLGCNPFLAVGAPVTMAQRLMIGIGAGVYEEIVFRALMITFIHVVLRHVGASEGRCVVVAVVLSAFLFSMFHYVGEFGEPFDGVTFVFRFIAGVLLSAIYALRGLGISAWSHALYDVFLVFEWL